MNKVKDCTFCDKHSLNWRMIASDEVMTSFVSSPRFREGQCLVIPNRHIEHVTQLHEVEASSIMIELGRLAVKLDKGFGSGIMQKYQPLQTENGIKVDHLHFHVFPRIEDEASLFPVPEPNNFDAFVRVSTDEIIELAESLR